MRDHSKLEAFALADELAIATYAATKSFPNEERFGLSSPLRRAAVSVAANIVEASARSSEREYIHMLGVAYASAKELQYEISLATRLGYVDVPTATHLATSASRTARALWSLISTLRSRRLSATRR